MGLVPIVHEQIAFATIFEKLKLNGFLPGQLVLNPFDDRVEVPLLMDIIQIVRSDREDRTQVKRAQPVVVERIEQGEIFGRDTGLHIPGAAADAIHQYIHRRLEVD